MSYTFKVVVKDGKAEIAEGNYVTPPDGEYMVNGHVGDDWESINVTRYTSPSQMAFQATAWAKK